MKHVLLFILFLIMMVSSPLFSQLLGDVNSNGVVDIVDALLIAQYYVDLEPQGIDLSVMDVNGDGLIDIVDALLIARYYVGLIPDFSVTPTPTPIHEETPIPADTPVPTVTPVPTDEPTPTPPALRWTANFWYRQTGAVYAEKLSIPNNTDTSISLLTAELRPAEVMGFGGNGFNVLGLDLGLADLTTFPLVIPICDVADVEAGMLVSFFLKKDGSLWGCGSNLTGLMGDASEFDKVELYPIELMSGGVKKVSVNNFHTLILKTDGSLWVCGSNKRFALGYDSPEDEVLTPYQLMSSGVADIAAGNIFSLAVKTDGSLWAWGQSLYGQLGIGVDRADEKYPVQVIDSGVVSVSAGSNYSTAVKSDGSLWAAGDSVLYNEATGTYTNTNTFIRVLDSGVMKVVAGPDNILALMDDGSLWGYRYTRLSDVPGTVQETTYPGWVIIESGEVVDMDVGSSASLWIKTDGSLWGCGFNTLGQLAQPELDPYMPPVRIYASGVSKVAAGHFQTLVLRTSDAHVFSHLLTLPDIIPPRTSYDFSILFDAYQEGDYGGVLSVTTSDPDHPTIDFSITGSSRITPPDPTPVPTPVSTGLLP